MRRHTAVFVLSILLSGTSETATAGELDPCQLLTREEVSEALATPARPGVVGGLSRRGAEVVGGQCNYRAEAGFRDQLSVSMEAYPGLDFDRSFALTCKNATIKQIPGVGRGACAFVSPAGFVNLTVRAAGGLLRFSMSSSKTEDAVAAIAQLGRIAAERFDGGGAVARVPGLEAFLGNWTIHPPSLSPRVTKAAIGLINVRDQGPWSLQESDDRQGVLATQGDRFVLTLRGLRLEGTFEAKSELVMRTQGMLNAEFYRIGCGKVPWKVDPALLSGFGSPTRTLPKKPSPDPRWAGLWRGQGQLGGQPVIVLWYVLPGGDARQLVVREREGRLRAKDGKLEFEPNLARRVEGRYVVHDADTLEVSLPSGTNIWKRRPYGARPKPAALRGPCGPRKFK